MAGRSKRKHCRKGRPEPEINVTPLVDIVLVLLIIFMVVTPSLAEGETIEPPAVARLDRAPRDINPINVILAANGRTLLNQKPVGDQQLEQELRTLHRAKPNRQLLLNTDTKVPYGRVRSTLALLQKVGFKGVSLKVRPRREDENS
jgi:biopolymer transport protein TolR